MLRSPRFRLWLLAILTVAAAFFFWGLPVVSPQQPMAIEFGQEQDSE